MKKKNNNPKKQLRVRQHNIGQDLGCNSAPMLASNQIYFLTIQNIASGGSVNFGNIFIRGLEAGDSGETPPPIPPFPPTP